MEVSCNAVPDDPHAVLAAALDAYVAIDASGRVVSWNPAAERTFGFSYADACGRTVEELIIPARYRAAHRAGLARLAANEPGRVLGQRLQLFALHRDGHEFPVELTLTATDERDGRMFHAFAHDVTAAQRASQFLAVESAVARGLAEADSSATAAARVVEALGVRMEWPVVELWLVDERRQLLCCEARYVERGRNIGHFAVDEMEPGMGLPGRVFLHNRAHWIPDLAQDSRSVRSRAAARAGLHLATGVPICAAEQSLGALCVYGDHVEETDEGVMALLSGVAAQLGQYLDRRRAEELAIELARTKDEFLTLVTHELRNPLSVIMATASLAEEELDTLSLEDQRGYLRTISRSAQRLSVLAEDLLDLGRLESGHLGMRPEPTDLSAIVGAAVQAHAGLAEAKALTVNVLVPPEVPLYADPHRLRQVADNLLSNAIKYTPSGGTVTVSVNTGPTDQVTWTVADTGIGIPLADRPRMFRRFYRASTAVDKRIPGTGLGLVITRAIIERHHGTIDLADGHTPGTKFVIQLPTKPPPSPE
ncbi:PAS domain S-box-containing protein [Krasilnikovia cinnamomea]|uniref:histidine kinase n=1 Tax=Krasilnikovia cinnamomea TaxID=349313 RepID=A0A4Q7ZGG5_9ACTN|nr:ATP-binding protein [Krasilnikovia cinnamomea]RZU49882.1 PAS domain S-box-containing protein [Krasilnikovia cinnamomea]